MYSTDSETFQQYVHSFHTYLHGKVDILTLYKSIELQFIYDGTHTLQCSILRRLTVKIWLQGYVVNMNVVFPLPSHALNQELETFYSIEGMLEKIKSVRNVIKIF